MQTTFIHRQGHDRLLVYFAGWGADATPFRQYLPQGHDYLLCYDYRDLSLDTNLLNGYREVDVVGWSMGVWAASHIVPTWTVPTGQCIALNGTPWPVDEHRGIAPDIYEGTLQGLTEVTLHKFLRRMCGTSDVFRQFLSVTPRRPLPDLREELEAIAREQACRPLPEALPWTHAVVGMADRIILPDNQLRAWLEVGVHVVRLPVAHYHPDLFQTYLEDLWTSK